MEILPHESRTQPLILHPWVEFVELYDGGLKPLPTLRHARELGANAVVGVRYDASEVVSKTSPMEVSGYGTAFVIEKA